jgi:predicted dehydrogenase
MLRSVSPDVVHITTPPQSHHALGRACLEAGSHVYMEKPFTVTAAEAQSLIELATQQGLRITAGHNYQFVPEMREMRRLVGDGFLGGPPVHLESTWSYDLGDVSYVAPVVGSPDHWVRRLPGQLLHNLISHGIARLAEFLDDEVTDLSCIFHQSPVLRGSGVTDLQDELRVVLRDGKGTTGFFCFSTQLKPGRNCLQICGPRNSIHVNVAHGAVVREAGRSYKSYLTFLVPLLAAAKAQAGNAGHNLTAILRRRLYQDSGMTELIQRFHACLTDGGLDPIPHREILLTARIMDRIFAHYPKTSSALPAAVAGA